ncbi:hypothetical protein BM477_06750 [Boudabousia marimammalium]|uniref:N-acetyltransferase domain-containing protein n=1 Tax=Boudabousia marimammalium TaxID=156892 RepID=A0A1Q5PLC5_9ACTO|nr:hypothetical protein BM477_06750 [Boudabousia marimammalium]
MPPTQLEMVPLTGCDLADLLRLRQAEDGWLSPTNATSPPGYVTGAPSFGTYVKAAQRDLAEGRHVTFGIWADGELAGEISVGGISRQALCSGMAGYWLRRSRVGQGIMPLALASVIEFMLTEGNLHRVEVNIMPRNQASIRVVEKLGLRAEGVRRSYLHVAGSWEDHVSYAVTAEELAGGGLVSRLLADH